MLCFYVLGKFIESIREKYQVVKRRREYHGCVGKNITWKRGREKQYHLPYNVVAAGKNIKKGRGKGNMGGGDQELNKMGVRKNISMVYNGLLRLFYCSCNNDQHIHMT